MVRDARFGVGAEFRGIEGPDALLSDTSRMQAAFGTPETSTTRLLELVAEWVEQGGPLLGKPTRFEARDGKF